MYRTKAKEGRYKLVYVPGGECKRYMSGSLRNGALTLQFCTNEIFGQKQAIIRVIHVVLNIVVNSFSPRKK